MQRSTIFALNKINQDFYQHVGAEFSLTRAKAWEGWLALLSEWRDLAKHSGWSLLDIGCGNGRFCNFLQKQIRGEKGEYIGVDSSKVLLDIAQKLPTSEALSRQFIHQDFLQDLLEDGHFFRSLPKTDVIVLFGVLHHIPSFKLRQQLFLTLQDVLKKHGKLIWTAWQFDRLPKLIKRRHSSQMKIEDLEKNDYFLDWNKDQSAIRYCHLIDANETEKLLNQTRLKITNQFCSDGKYFSNTYYVCEKY